MRGGAVKGNGGALKEVPAVHGQHGSGDVAGRFGYEKEHRSCDILRIAQTPERRLLPGMVEDAMKGDIDLAPFVTHTMGLEEINEAFELMHEGKSIRTVIHY